MIIQVTKSWFSEMIETVPHSEEAKAYVSSVYAKFAVCADGDLSKDLILKKFVEARSIADFASLQSIGDWVLWSNTFWNKNNEAIESAGRLSYYACHRLMNGKWQVFEELGDNLPEIVKNARLALKLQ